MLKSSYEGKVVKAIDGRYNSELISIISDDRNKLNQAIKDEHGDTAFLYAARKDWVWGAIKLAREGSDIKYQNWNGETALILATYNGHLECMKALIKCGAELNRQNKHCQTALYVAAYSGYLECIKLLIENGADMNLKDKKGETALSTAAYRGYSDCVSILVKNGADINSQNQLGYTPLVCAANSGYFDCVKILIENGANHKIKDIWGKTVTLSTESIIIKSYLRNLEKNESEWMFACRIGDAPEVEKILREDKKLNINEIGVGGNTGLHFVARANSIDLYTLLVSNGADQSIANKNGQIPFSLFNEKAKLKIFSAQKIFNTSTNGK